MDSPCGKNATRDLHVEKSLIRSDDVETRKVLLLMRWDDVSYQNRQEMNGDVNLSGEKFLEQKSEILFTLSLTFVASRNSSFMN